MKALGDQRRTYSPSPGRLLISPLCCRVCRSARRLRLAGETPRPRTGTPEGGAGRSANYEVPDTPPPADRNRGGAGRSADYEARETRPARGTPTPEGGAGRSANSRGRCRTVRRPGAAAETT